MLNKREFLYSGLATLALAGAGGLFFLRQPGEAAAEGSFEVTHTTAEWRKLLTDAQFSVLREHGTERPWTSALLNEKRTGVFHCAGCDLALYASENKYDSGTGWPSFDRALPNAIGTTQDTSYGMVRTECHCRRCGGHLGHIFNDGPRETTGERHCINGVALTFKANSGA